MEYEGGILVANPGSLSLAIRSALIDTATNGGVMSNFVTRLAETQESFALSTGFWPVPELRLSAMNRHLMRAGVVQFAPGRYLHVMQVLPDPTSFADAGFAGMVALREGAEASIASDVSRFWEFLSTQPDHRESISVLLLSGWGGSTMIRLQINESNAPAGWQYLALSFADAATLGACEDGRPWDLKRIQDQLDILEGAGYQIQRLNGAINLFGNWRDTDANFIPEHWDADPPSVLWLPQNSLLKPRIEGESNRDVHSLRLPNGDFGIVQRAEWGQDGGVKPIYGSLESIRSGRLVGAVILKKRSWWIEVINRTDASDQREWQFQIWNAVVQWLGVAAPTLISALPRDLPPAACLIRIVIQGSGEPQFEEIRSFAGEARDYIELRKSDDVYEVVVTKHWENFIGRIANDAEFALASAVVEQIGNATGHSISRSEIDRVLRQAIPSTDWRYLHAFEARYPLERLAAHGFYPRFRKISRSAAALVRCGSVWGFWDCSRGREYQGEQECRDFLKTYYDFILNDLIHQIRFFDRKLLLQSAALAYGAARAESDQWKRTIRAMRSIHGPSIDGSAMRRSSEFNAVQRAAKTVCEIASCEAKDVGGAIPAYEDLDEMFARALLLFGNGQLYATIRGGLVKPHLKVSPAGDLLSDRSLFEKTFVPSSERFHLKAMNEASENYAERFAAEAEPETGEKLNWSDALRKAVSAEYCCSPEAFIDIQFRITQLCESAGSGVIFMRRSELSSAITADENFPDRDVVKLLDRLTLPRRDDWTIKPEGYMSRDLDLWRFDRKYSTIARPLISLSSEDDPFLMVSPIFVSDSIMYQLGALHYATVHSDGFWNSKEARAYAGARAKEIGEAFEDDVARRLNDAGYVTSPRKKITALLGQAVDGDLGDVDVFAQSRDGRHVVAIEAKSLKLCRTEAEVAARMTDYAGKVQVDDKGREKPDKLLRHLRRVQYLREHKVRLGQRLGLSAAPEVHGLMVVDAPQPMNFYMLESNTDAASCMADDLIDVMKELTR